MANKIDLFYSDLFRSGLARPNRFEVIITPPVSSDSLLHSQGLLRHLTISCESVELPSNVISTIDYKVNGLMPQSLPYSFSYGGTLDITFRLSEDYKERNFLLAWQNLIYTPVVGFKYYNEYQGTIVVRPLTYHQSQGEESNQEFVLYNCFPTTVQNLSYDQGMGNSYLKQTASFSFYYIETRKISVATSNKNIDSLRFDDISRFNNGLT